MSKITFRADDALVDAVEDLDASKSEVMRDALQAYLAERGLTQTVDDIVAERVDDVAGRRRGVEHDVNVRITVETEGDVRANDPSGSSRVGATRDARERPAGHETVQDPARRTPTKTDATTTCAQCGQALSDDHVYCPTCGEKAAQRVFCECGDEVRTDWAFCPHCGRRTASADAVDQ